MDEDTENSINEEWTEWMDVRINALENQYEQQHVTDIDKATLEKLRKEISRLLGEQNANLFHAYTDRLIAIYNRDADWFYKQGWQDAMHVMQDVPLDWLREK